MGRTTLLFTILLLSAALPLVAQPQQQESLGDLARQLREQTQQVTPKRPTKVFTNDNLPTPIPGEAVTRIGPGLPWTSMPSTPGKPMPNQPSPIVRGDRAATSAESPEDKVKTRDYWQGKFKEARQDVAKAKEQQQLAEDELNLLQIQQVRELDPIAKPDLTAKVQDKQSEVNIDKESTDAAQKALDDLEKEFKDSGAPEDWSKTE